MTMLSLFEEEIQAEAARVLDVRCAACAGMGTLMDRKTPCPGCGGAAWLVLGDHPLPCAACKDPRRATRPKPSDSVADLCGVIGHVVILGVCVRCGETLPNPTESTKESS